MNRRIKIIIRIVLFFGTLISLVFVPWPLVTAWIQPLPKTIQEQVDRAGDYGFDGIVVGVQYHGNHFETYTSGYDHFQYIQEAMLEPLNLTRTFESITKVDNTDQ